MVRRTLVLGSLFLFAMEKDLPGQDRSGTGRRLSGLVIDHAGAPVPYAYVAAASGSNTVTDGAGRFSASVPSGAQQVSWMVRRIGFKPVDPLLTVANDDRPHAIVMTPIGAVLDTVRIDAVSGYDEYLDRSGYYRRLSNKVHGTFISADQIERRNAIETSAIFRDVTGVRVSTRAGVGGRKNYVLGRGGLGALGLVVDGQRVEIESPPRESLQPRITSMGGGPRTSATVTRSAPPGAGTLDDMVSVSMIGAIEVYPSAASVPNSLAHHVDGCGLIVVWTRYQEIAK